MKTSTLSASISLCLACVFPSQLKAGNILFDHEFRGSGEAVVLAGTSGSYTNKKIAFSDQPEPNGYIVYYQAPEPFEVQATDSPAGDPLKESALVVKRASGGPVDFGGFYLLLTMPDWNPGNVTVEDLDKLIVSFSRAATAGLQTPVFLEAQDTHDKFLARVPLPVSVVNDGEFHDFTCDISRLSAEQKKQLVDALNGAGSTNIDLNFPLKFDSPLNYPPPFLALKKLKLEVQ